MKQELPPRLKQLDEEMMAPGGPRYQHLFAVRGDDRYEIRIMKASEHSYTATTLQKVGTYLLKCSGRRPSEAFQKMTRTIEWNLRDDVQQTYSKSINAARESIFVPVSR